MKEETYLLGIDLGTSTVKAGLYTPTGREVALAGEEYLDIPEGQSTAEVDPDLFWQAIGRMVRQALSRVEGAGERVAAVSMSSHAETLIFLGCDGQPVRPAIFTTDGRAEAEAHQLAAHFGLPWLLEHTGQPEMVGLWPACKIAWLRAHESETFGRIAHYLLPEDYIFFRLTGELSAEPASWGSSALVDINTCDWLDPLLEYVGITRAQLPPLLAPGTPMGHVQAGPARELGLRPGIPVVVGAMDQNCAAVAAGNIAPGVITASTGSVLALVATSDRPIFDPVTKVSCYPHVAPGSYCLIPWNPTGGLVLKWFKDRFGEAEQAEARRTGESAYDLLCRAAAAVPPGCDGLTMVPHLQGILFPEANPAMRGVFCGFSLAHTRAHFTRAILEAIAFMLRSGLEALMGLGVEVREVRLLGGGARSRLWTQIKADVCQRPVVVPATSEAAVMGAAMLAGVGAGIFPGVPAAVERMVKLQARIEPNPALAETYDAAYARYQALYRQVKPLFKEDNHARNDL